MSVFFSVFLQDLIKNVMKMKKARANVGSLGPSPPFSAKLLKSVITFFRLLKILPFIFGHVLKNRIKDRKLMVKKAKLRKARAKAHYSDSNFQSLFGLFLLSALGHSAFRYLFIIL